MRRKKFILIKSIILLISLILISKISIVQAIDVSGVISTDTTWTANNSPYNVVGDVQIPAGVTLTIEPNVIIKYTGEYEILVKGSIIANGTAGNIITFTSSTNSSSNAIQIKFKETNLANTKISYVKMEYASKAIYTASGSTGTLVVSNLQLANAQVTAGAGSITISNSTITNATVNISGGSADTTLLIQDSTITNSTISLDYASSKNLIIQRSNMTKVNVYADPDIVSSTTLKILDSTMKDSKIRAGTSSNCEVSKSLLINSYIDGTFGDQLTIKNSILTYNGEYGILTYHSMYPSILNISYSTIIGNGKGTGIYMAQGSVSYTTICNTATAVKIGSGGPTISNTNFINNSIYNIENRASNNISATNNYWGTTDTEQIATKIFDYYDDINFGIVNYSSYLNSHDTTAPISPPSNVIAVRGTDGIKVEWSPSLETDLAGYKVYWDVDSGYPYTNYLDVGNMTSCTVDLSAKCIAVTAYDNSKDGTNDMADGNESYYALTPIYNSLPNSITSNTTLYASKSPYIVIEDVYLQSLCTLTIEAGTKIQFKDGKKLTIKGILNVNGTESNKVVFTSTHPETATKSSWLGVIIDAKNGGTCTIKHAKFEFASTALEFTLIDNNDGNKDSVIDTIFRNNEIALGGYVGNRVNTLVERCIFENNTYGICAADYDIYHSKFKNNKYGLYRTERVNVYHSTFEGNTEAALYGGRGQLKFNTIKNNKIGVKSFWEGFTLFTCNNIHNNEIGVILGQYDSYSPKLNYNNIYSNTKYNLKNTTSGAKDASNNWWGTTNIDTIDLKIFDGKDDGSYGVVDYTPILTSLFIYRTPSITTTSLPSEKINTAYSQTLQVSGGISPYTWSIISGSLPPGLILDSSTGVISGTPTTAGTFYFTVKVTDGANESATKDLSIEITKDISYGSISGLVTDLNGNPIAGALVKLRNDTISYASEVFTDTEGKFSFTNLQPNSYEIEVSCIGYVSTKQTIMVEAEKETKVTFRLSKIVTPDIPAEEEKPDGTKIEIPAGALPESGFVTIEKEVPVELKEKVEKAIKEAEATSLKTFIPGCFRVIEIYSLAHGGRIRELNEAVTISIPYPDTNSDNIVDKTTISIFALIMTYFDEESGSWIDIKNSQVDTINKVVKAKVKHLSVFSIIGRALSSPKEEEIPVYPNPVKGQDKVIFLDLSPNSSVKIYDLTGELVVDFYADFSGKAEWNLINKEGSIVANGLYFYEVIHTSKKKVIGRLVVMR